uniref:Uncharacterized protein n=1 Tax=Ditylenchus dipsaci TaxID=166011 RepID=A0A915EBT8_9BILA
MPILLFLHNNNWTDAKVIHPLSTSDQAIVLSQNADNYTNQTVLPAQYHTSSNDNNSQDTQNLSQE